MSDDWVKNLLGLSDGTTVKADEKEYESPTGGGGFSLFPNNTSVKAAIDEAKWSKDKENRERLSIRWTILAPEEYANRKVFQNLWIKGVDPYELEKGGEEKAIAKRDRQRMMFGAIDANAGGKLAELLMDGVEIKDEHLMKHLTNKPMVIRIDLMVPRGSGDPRNFVAKISPKTSAVSTPEEIAKGNAEVSGLKKTSSSMASRNLDDEIPFD